MIQPICQVLQPGINYRNVKEIVRYPLGHSDSDSSHHHLYHVRITFASRFQVMTTVCLVWHKRCSSSFTGRRANCLKNLNSIRAQSTRKGLVERTIITESYFLMDMIGLSLLWSNAPTIAQHNQLDSVLSPRSPYPIYTMTSGNLIALPSNLQ
jgi:hypothetical protein